VTHPESIVVQTELQRQDTDAFMVVWLPVDARVKVGSIISLKSGPEVRWIVRRQFTRLAIELVRYKGWNVGGLA
jgi:hypothetical protein